ncbi:MAG: transposase [Pseudomonadota bacterium]
MSQAGLPAVSPETPTRQWAYVFGAICPDRGKAAGIVMPWADKHVMNLHLAEISPPADPGARAEVILDQAVWHTTKRLAVPEDIPLLPLPPRSRELKPVESVWQCMRDKRLSNRAFGGRDYTVVHCCEAWNKLVDQPWRIVTIGMRDGAHGS